MTLQELARQFVIAINAHDVEYLANLTTSDHRFIDSLGTIIQGRDAMREGWTFYFSMVPDYHLDISRSLSRRMAKLRRCSWAWRAVHTGRMALSDQTLRGQRRLLCGLSSATVRLPSGRCRRIMNRFASKCALRRPTQTIQRTQHFVATAENVRGLIFKVLS